LYMSMQAIEGAGELPDITWVLCGQHVGHFVVQLSSRCGELANDSAARFQFGLDEMADEFTRDATSEFLTHARQCRGRAIGGQRELTASAEEKIDRVLELADRCLLAQKKLDVIDQQELDLAKFPPEIRKTTTLKGFQKLSG